FQRNAGVVLVESVLLQEAQADDAGDFQRQFLIIGQYVASDQLDDFHQGTFLIEEGHDLVSKIHKIFIDVVFVPGRQVVQILAVAGQPVDGREVSGVCQRLVQSPETADIPFGVHGNRFREVAALGRYGADDGDGSFRTV